MKAVILAAGRSTRTWPVTKDIPKPLLPILGTPLLGYTIGGLKDQIEEWHILTHHEDTLVQEYLEETFPDLTMHFTPVVPDGTGVVRFLAEDLRDEEAFLVLNGDDLYHPRDIQRLIQAETPNAVLAKEVEDPSRFGVFVLESDHVKELVEKPATPISNLANAGAYKFSGRIFEHTLTMSPRGEYEIVEYINALIAKGEDITLVTVEGYWLPITYPWDILHAQRYFLETADIAWRIDPSAQVDGSAFIGKNVYIGKNCVVEADVELEDVCLLEDVYIGTFSRIHASVLAPGTKVEAETLVTPKEGKHALRIADKDPVEISPTYCGAFTASHTTLSGYVEGPSFHS